MEGLAPLNQGQRLREIARAGRSRRCIASEKISRDSVRNLNKQNTPVSLHSIHLYPFPLISLFVMIVSSVEQATDGEPTPAE
jgi:hypothetical protein